MTYKEYIDLGFKRHDMNDQVEFNRTGYSGYYLELNIAKHVSIEVCNGELEKPKLYIGKDGAVTSKIITLTKEQILELVKKDQVKPMYA